MRIDVEAYSGFKGDERPVRFRLGDRWLGVVAVEDQWYEPNAIYFRVAADDGDVYILRHDEQGDEWTLTAFRRSEG